MGASRVVRVTDLQPGWEITEVDTPEGEWYRVVAVDPQRNLLVVDDGIELPLSGDGALVLARDLST